MSVQSRLFTRLHNAEFYRSALRNAVRLLPAGEGRIFLDVGCGPGMLTRLAADHGYQATGIDTDTSMIAAARRLGRREQSSAVFVDRSLTDEPPMEPADVVAAASLLVVVPDPIVALGTLWQAVAPGGALLVVEATERLTTQRAASLIATGTLGRGATILRLWARARQGRTLDVSMLRGHPDTSEIVSTSLLDGMIGVWLIRPRIVSS